MWHFKWHNKWQLNWLDTWNWIFKKCLYVIFLILWLVSNYFEQVLFLTKYYFKKVVFLKKHFSISFFYLIFFYKLYGFFSAVHTKLDPKVRYIKDQNFGPTMINQVTLNKRRSGLKLSSISQTCRHITEQYSKKSSGRKPPNHRHSRNRLFFPPPKRNELWNHLSSLAFSEKKKR